MEIILTNAFTKDTLALRGVRLQEVERSIDDLQPTLNLEAALLAWAQACHTNFMDIWSTAGVEQGEKEGAFLTLTAKDKEMEETYADIRIIALARYANDPDNLKDFEFDKLFPDGTKARLDVVREVVKATQRHRDAGIAHALPVVFTDKLTAAIVDVESAYDDADLERFESEHASRTLWNLMRSDAIKLRELLGWARSIWGRYDLRFELIGMVPAKKHGGGQPDAPENLTFDSATDTFSWTETENTTSYQLAYSLDGNDWEEAYAGAETSCVFDPGDDKKFFRVRARNVHGFGDWSNVLVIEHGVALAAPANFKFADDKQFFQWDDVVGALMYHLAISRDGGQSWAKVYDDIDRYFDASTQDAGAALARVRAIDGYFEPGEWTEPLAVQFKLRTPTTLMYDQYRNQFTCDFVPGATGYRFELGQVGGTIQVIDIPENHFVRDLGFGDWKARVRAYRGAELSDWSHTIEVHIILAAPEDLEYNGGAKRIDWDKVASAKLYHLVNETGTISYIGADKHFDIELTAPEKFRVRAGDDTMEVWGEWTAWTMLG